MSNSSSVSSQTVVKSVSEPELWMGCFVCQEKCCNMEIAHPLFVTDQEMEQIRSAHPDKAEQFNKTQLCPFLMDDGLCLIQESKPVDCRLFPFDIIKLDGKFYWIIRNINCLISCERLRFEDYLNGLEEKLIPGFSPYLDDYSSFRLDELCCKYSYEIIREVRVNGKSVG